AFIGRRTWSKQPAFKENLQYLPTHNGRRSQNRRFLRQGSQGKPYRDRRRTIFQVSRKAPEGKPGRRQIHERQRTLREENGVQRRAQRRRSRNLNVGDALGQTKN